MSVALKLATPVAETQSEFPLYNLLTKVLIDSLCPLLKSELQFGNRATNPGKEKFSYWIDAEISGDVQGKIGLGADEYTLGALAKELKCVRSNAQTDVEKTLVYLHETLASGFEKHFSEEDFQCELKKGSGLLRDHLVETTSDSHFLCPVETRFGQIQVFLALKPNSPALIEEFKKKTGFEPRKIRVFASELDFLYTNIKSLEAMEKGSKTQVRGQIKRLKRMVNQMRTEPLETLFLPARRLASDIAKQQGKQVELKTTGTWAYLEKPLLNYLYEPILHLVRNAVDHGIEEPSERERLGKPPHGTIKCLATFNSDGFKIILSDDGRGINFESLRERAIAKGFVPSEKAVSMHIDQLLPLIFESGFSTRERTDSISGRGLGLDIVKKGIQSIDGTLRVLSTSTKGTSFEIHIPLNEDFTLKKMDEDNVFGVTPVDEEKVNLLDELFGYLDRLHRTLQAYIESNILTSAYEAFRLVHSIKGVSGFLGWTKVSTFCHHFEELLKLVADRKVEGNDDLKHVLFEAGMRTKEFCEASRREQEFPLTEIRKLEARILQFVWSASHQEERTHQFIGKYHLNAVEKFMAPFLRADRLVAFPESDFSKAACQPFGALVQFDGDRRGFAGVFMSDDVFSEWIYPAITGAKGKAPVKNKVTALSEFAKVIGRQISELAQKSGISLQTGAPLTYYGWGKPLRILGTPTYCYRCEIGGREFFLAGDFRLPQDVVAANEPEALSYHPNLVLQEIKNQCEKKFALVKPEFNQLSTQSDLIGFDNGVTTILTCLSKTQETPDTVVFLSFDGLLARHLYQSGHEGQPPPENLDLYDYLNEIGSRLATGLIEDLEKKKLTLELGSPSIFLGKAYVSNFNRLFITNKIVGNTSKGKFEIQVLVTKLAD